MNKLPPPQITKMQRRKGIHDKRDEVESESDEAATTLEKQKTSPPKYEDESIKNGKYKSKVVPSKPSKPRSIQTYTTFKILLVVVFSFGILAAFLFLQKLKTKGEKKLCSYEELAKNPPNNEYMWASLTAGIERILNQEGSKPGVYLFMYDGSDNSLGDLVKKIANHSSSCFGNHLSPVELHKDDFISVGEYGQTIEKYKGKIKKGKVILVVNLNEIPAKAARALHTICDTANPLVKDVVIFLTLYVPASKEIPIKIAEDAIRKLWGTKLESYELDPLITRLTDEVFLLQH